MTNNTMNATALRELRTILAELYTDENSIRRVVADAGIEIARITFGGSALNTWHAVLIEANKLEQINAILNVVADEYADNQGFRSWRQRQLPSAPAAGTKPALSKENPRIRRSRRWLVLPVTVLLLVAIGFLLRNAGLLTFGVVPTKVPNTVAERTSVVAATETQDLTVAPAVAAIIAPSTVATATMSISATLPPTTPSATTVPTPAPTAAPTLMTKTTLDSAAGLRVLDDLTEYTYLLEGGNVAQFQVGDELLVYAEPNPGVEITIALLAVVGNSPTALTAQALLVHPQYPIRTNMRVDDQLAHLSTSQLVPVFAYAEGYLLRAGRVRLQPDHDLTVGTALQALALERIDGEIVDALPTDVVMQVTSIGVDGQIAAVELLTGTWPLTGTIVALVEEGDAAGN